MTNAWPVPLTSVILRSAFEKKQCYASVQVWAKMPVRDRIWSYSTLVCVHMCARAHAHVCIYIIRTYIHLHIHITLYKTYVHTFLYYGIRSILGANLFMNRGVQQTHLQLQLGTLTLIRSKYKENWNPFRIQLAENPETYWESSVQCLVYDIGSLLSS